MNQGQPDKYEVSVADYRWKYILYACVCWGLVLAGFLTFYNSERNWQFWMAEAVMLMFALGLTYMLISPKYIFIGRKGPRFDEYLNNKYNDLVSQDGVFSFVEQGFVFHGEEGDIEIKWEQITRISGHLEDILSNDDDIVIRLEYDEGKHFLEFDEEIGGWLKFRQEMRSHFNFSPEWQNELIQSGKKEILIWELPSTTSIK